MKKLVALPGDHDSAMSDGGGASMKRRRGPARGMALWQYLQPLMEFVNIPLAFRFKPDEPLSESDKELLRDYLGRYAPHLFLKDAEYVRMEAQENPEKFRIWGSVWHFQKSAGIDWFDSDEAKNFCALQTDLRNILELYADDDLTEGFLKARLESQLRRFPLCLALENRATGELRPLEPRPKRVDLQSSKLTLSPDTQEICGDYYGLDLGELILRLVRGVFLILSNNLRVIACARRKCNNLFIPKPGAPTRGKVPKYCPSCRSKRKT